MVARENGNPVAQQGLNVLDSSGMISPTRLSGITQRANEIYAQLPSKNGFQYKRVSTQVSGLRQYCESVVMSVDTIALYRKHGRPMSEAYQLIVGMTDPKAIAMTEGAIDWVWQYPRSLDQLHNDFLDNCLNRSPAVAFIY